MFTSNRNYILYSAVTILLLVVFGLKDTWILSVGVWPHLYPVVDVPRAIWEEIYCYLPLAKISLLSNPFQAAPMVDSQITNFTFFPMLSVLFQRVLYQVVFFQNLDAYLWFMHTLLPILSFWIIFLILRRYIDVSWALLLAFLGVTTFPSFSLMQYVTSVGSFQDLIHTASISPMELTRIPSPSFTFLFFIFTFYMSIRKRKFTKAYYLKISVLWGLNLYVYLYNFMGGVVFWFFYIIFTRYIRDGGRITPSAIKTLAKNFLVLLIVISPFVIKTFMLTPLDAEIFERMGLVGKESGFMFGDWGWIFSYLLPVIVVVAIIWIFCADYYELVYKFTPIFILIFVEVFVSNIHIVLGKFFQPGLFSIRVSDFFLRYLYFVPVLYFLSQPRKKLFHDDIKDRIADVIYSVSSLLIIRPRKYIAAAGILVASSFSIFSSIHYVNHYDKTVAPRMQVVMEKFQALKGSVDGQAAVVSEDLPVNLIIPVLSENRTLLINGFSNYVSDQEILERLILYAHIFNWQEETFLTFMMPAEEYVNYNWKNNFIFSDKILQKGFGYWLLKHKKKMTQDELAAYREGILEKFRAVNVQGLIEKYNVKAIQSARELNTGIQVNRVQDAGDYKIYFL